MGGPHPERGRPPRATADCLHPQHAHNGRHGQAAIVQLCMRPHKQHGFTDQSYQVASQRESDREAGASCQAGYALLKMSLSNRKLHHGIAPVLDKALRASSILQTVTNNMLCIKSMRYYKSNSNARTRLASKQPTSARRQPVYTG